MRVMILDNDCALLRSLTILLERAGHRVRAFADPVTALEDLAVGPGPEALVLDYVMPHMDGLEVLRRVRAGLPTGCRVVLISGHSDQIDPAVLARDGVDAFLSKPLALDELNRLIGGRKGDPAADLTRPRGGRA